MSAHSSAYPRSSDPDLVAVFQRPVQNRTFPQNLEGVRESLRTLRGGFAVHARGDAHGIMASDSWGEVWATLEILEQSKYSLRMILLLHANSAVSLSWLLRHLPTSAETVVRCARILESSGFVSSAREGGGRRRRLYALTPRGEAVATSAPPAWAPTESVKVN